jgi:hypothetical protein
MVLLDKISQFGLISDEHQCWPNEGTTFGLNKKVINSKSKTLFQPHSRCEMAILVGKHKETIEYGLLITDALKMVTEMFSWSTQPKELRMLGQLQTESTSTNISDYTRFWKTDWSTDSIAQQQIKAYWLNTGNSTVVLYKNIEGDHVIISMISSVKVLRLGYFEIQKHKLKIISQQEKDFNTILYKPRNQGYKYKGKTYPG